MKVLLIFPELSRTNYDFVGISEDDPLELEYLATVLKEHAHEVAFSDGQIGKINIAAKIKTYKPDVVYLCGRVRQENFMLEYCQTQDFNSARQCACTTLLSATIQRICRLYHHVI